MKTTVYAARIAGKWVWRLTIDWRVDFYYGLPRHDAQLGLVRLEPQLSWGQALRLSQLLAGNAGWQDKLNAAWQTEHRCNEVRGELRKIGSHAGIGLAKELCIKRMEIGNDAARERTSDIPEIDPGELDRMVESLRGRSLFLDEWLTLLDEWGMDKLKQNWPVYLQASYLSKRIELAGGVMHKEDKDPARWWKRRDEFRCMRCGTGMEGLRESECQSCGGPCLYCERCLTMGRSRSCSVLLLGKPHSPEVEPEGREDTVVPDAELLTKWSLSPAQSDAALAGLRFLRDPVRTDVPPSFLIWAVTGAGKTEMIFPFIEQERRRGGKVLIAVPRRDVVLELAPRLKLAFPDESIVVLYGGSGERWSTGGITLSTTHQLLRFQHGFDMAVIDEMDAFPLHNNPMLEYAVRKSLKPGGRFILLSATPPAALQRDARRGKLRHVRVPVRYHRHPLPVPDYLRTPLIGRFIAAAKLPDKLVQAIRKSIERGALVFLFVPQIKQVNPIAKLLRNAFPSSIVEGTSSVDAERGTKVMGFRERNIDILVTTTILERGVTVPKSDVIVLEAGSGVFDEAALVQMAGRAGRSKEDPRGNVYFCSPELTGTQAGAIRQIRRMNKIAARQGFLIGKSVRGEPI
jgi:competence protein ComFA